MEGFAPFAYGCGSKPMGSHFGVGEFTTHSRAYVSGDWDDLDFDPWPYVNAWECSPCCHAQRDLARFGQAEVLCNALWVCIRHLPFSLPF